MTFAGPERRKHPRISAHFIVSYRIMDEVDGIDTTQTKNLSLGGMLLTTNRAFPPGTNLALEIRLPFDPNPMMLIGRVIESKQIIKEMLYDTRLEFLSVDDKHKSIINQTVDYYLKREKK
jgi:c-di-GMP-binding flagellar brake protein YcgR